MNPVVFISGSRRGLGMQIAHEYASHGFDIVLNGLHDKETLLKNKEILEKKNSCKVLVCFGDVSRESEVIRMLEEVKNTFSRLDVLVNNAAVVTDLELEDRSLELFEDTMRNNVSSVYLMCKHFGQFMYDSTIGGGGITDYKYF